MQTLDLGKAGDRMDQPNGKIERLDEKVGGLDRRVVRLEHKVDNLDHRVGRLEQAVDSLRAEINARFDSQQKTTIGGFVTLLAAMIATQL